jgi:hypothetical protein
MSDLFYCENGLYVTSFYGGIMRGPCLQFDAGSSLFTVNDVVKLVEALQIWLDKHRGKI